MIQNDISLGVVGAGLVPARLCHAMTDAGGRKGRPYGTGHGYVSAMAQ